MVKSGAVYCVMLRKLPLLPLYALACLVCCTSLLAEDKDARLRLTAAHSMYYTPTTAGLKSFHCEGTIDWKTMLTRLSGTEVSDENAALKFLKTVHLSVTDELKGTGSLGWAATGDPRRSIVERYADSLAYAAAIRTAAERLVEQRLMLAEDVERAVAAALSWDRSRHDVRLG